VQDRLNRIAEGGAVARPLKGKIDFDIRHSVPDWGAVVARKAPEGASNVLVVLYGD
jgi:hypothetical protein